MVLTQAYNVEYKLTQINSNINYISTESDKIIHETTQNNKTQLSKVIKYLNSSNLKIPMLSALVIEHGRDREVF